MNKWTLLHECARFGRTAVLGYLLNHPKTEEVLKSLCCKTNKFGSTQLHLCCKHGHVTTAQFLVSQFVPYDKFSLSRHQSFLQVAIEEKMTTFVNEFLSNFIITKDSPHQLSRKNIVNIVELICAKDCFKTSCLHYAAVRPSDQLYDVLIRCLIILNEFMENASLVRTLIYPDAAGNTVLHYSMGGNSIKGSLLVYHYFLLSTYRSTPHPSSKTTNLDLNSYNNPMNAQSGSMRHSPIFLACKYVHISLLDSLLFFYKDKKFEPLGEQQPHLSLLFKDVSPNLKKTSLYTFLTIQSQEEFDFVVNCWKQIKVSGIFDKLGHSPARVSGQEESDEELHGLFDRFNVWKITDEN